MTFEIVFVLLSLLGMVAALVADKMRPGMILFSVVVLFLCAGILTPKEMLEGFSNKGMITVALPGSVATGYESHQKHGRGTQLPIGTCRSDVLARRQTAGEHGTRHRRSALLQRQLQTAY